MRDAFYNNALSKANLRKAVTSRMPKVREAKLRAKMSSRVLLNFRHLSSAKTFPSPPVRQCGRKFPRKLLLSVPVTDDSRKTCVFRKLIFHPLSPCASRLSKNCYRMFFAKTSRFPQNFLENSWFCNMLWLVIDVLLHIASCGEIEKIKSHSGL